MTLFAPSLRPTLLAKFPARLARFAALALACALLPACVSRKADVTASVPTDVRDRHPIVLSEGRISMRVGTEVTEIDASNSRLIGTDRKSVV